MRVDRLALRGIGPFRDEVRIELAGVPGRLAAICGPNGAGKSTILEAGILGAIDRSAPTRGALTDLATTRDAFVELALDAGRPFVIRQSVDGVARKGEALLTNGAGEPVLADSKVTSFDEWRKANLPPTSVLLSTVFSAQGSGGFLDLSVADRKAVLLRALGIEGLEALAERARERARASQARVHALVAARDAERARANPAEKAAGALQFARGAAMAADQDLEIAREALRGARAQHADLVAAWEDAQAASEKRAVALLRAKEAEDEVARVSVRLQAAEQTLADADRVREAAARLEAARAERAALAEQRHAADAALAETNRELADLDRERDAAVEAYGAAQRRADAGEAAKRDLDHARSVSAGLMGKRAEVARIERERDQAAALAEDLAGKTTAGKDERIGRLRSVLTEFSRAPVDTPIEDVRSAADEAIEHDDESARSDEDLRQARRAAAAAQSAAHKAHLEAFFDLQAMENAAARIPDLEKAVQAAAEAEREMTTARARQEHADNSRRDVELRRTVRAAKAAELRGQVDELDREIAGLTPIAARLQDVTAAEARLEELRRAETTAEAALADARRTLDACPEPPDAEPVPDVSAQERAVGEAERAARAAHAAVAVAEKGLEDAQAAAERIVAQEREIAAEEEALSDWTRLGTDLGPKGVIAYEIDGAGPEISEIASSLLHECFGPRWTVSLTTTRPSADGKKDIETFEVRVLDTEAGRDGEAAGLSGGERVIVGEAISLALTTVACRRAGFERPTLVRDESGAALDPERARAYVAMLRRAADLIGADRVLLVSHSPEVVALCDARIEIEDGRVQVAA